MRRVAFDVRTLGRGPVVLITGAGVLCAAALAYARSAYPPSTAGRVLTACLEEALPLACGMASAGVIAGDRTLELQATARRAVARLALIRIGAVVGLSALAGALVYGLGAILGITAAHGNLSAALVFLAPALFLAGLAFASSVAVQGATAAAALIAGIWTAENAAYTLLSTGPLSRGFLFATTYTPHAATWSQNRDVLLLLAAALRAAGAAALHRPGTVLSLVQGDAS